MNKDKIVRFLICGVLAGVVYFIFFQTSIVSKWGIWPGLSFGDIDSQTWLSLHLRWLTFNKFAGYYWVALFIACAFGILSENLSKSDKCGSEKFEYGNIEITAEVYKHANKGRGPNLPYENKSMIQVHSLLDK